MTEQELFEMLGRLYARTALLEREVKALKEREAALSAELEAAKVPDA